MTVYVDGTEADLRWWKLWESTSLEELRLKCAVYGVDCEQWLRTDGHLWIPRNHYSSVLWYPKEA